jgi:hypothetical protein
MLVRVGIIARASAELENKNLTDGEFYLSIEFFPLYKKEHSVSPSM